MASEGARWQAFEDWCYCLGSADFHLVLRNQACTCGLVGYPLKGSRMLDCLGPFHGCGPRGDEEPSSGGLVLLDLACKMLIMNCAAVQCNQANLAPRLPPHL